MGINKKYLRSGAAVHLVDRLSNGQFLVSNILIDYDRDGYQYDYWSNDVMFTVSEIYDSAPTQLQDAQIVQLQEKIKELEDTKNKIIKEIASLESKEGDALKKLRRIDKLQYLFDFIDEKITHYVSFGYGTFEIIAFKDAISEYSQKETRMLSLFGRSGGEFAWKLNIYCDGSGGYREVIPCLSYEMALVEAQKLVDKIVAENESPRRDFILNAQKHGLKIPEEYIERYKAEWAASQARGIKNLERQIGELRQKVCDI